MNISTSLQSPKTFAADLLVLIVGQQGWRDDANIVAINECFNGELLNLAAMEGFEGSFAQTFSLHTLGALAARRVLLLGAGDSALSPDP